MKTSRTSWTWAGESVCYLLYYVCMYVCVRSCAAVCALLEAFLINWAIECMEYDPQDLHGL
jgi:hypothetical protein